MASIGAIGLRNCGERGVVPLPTGIAAPVLLDSLKITWRVWPPT
jgi:hypothetical protein